MDIHLQDPISNLQEVSKNWSLSVTLIGDFNTRHERTGDHFQSSRGF